METIVVLGATGRTGGATARRLVERGAAVRALTRDTAGRGAEELRRLGAEVVAADMNDTASLERAFDGATRLFNVQPAYDSRGRYMGEIELAQGTAVAQASGSAGIRHVVQMAAGRGEQAGLPHFDTKLAIRREFEAQGIPVSAIYPGPFMELMTDSSYAPALSVWGVEPRIVGWDRPLPWVAVDDIGRTAADFLMHPIPGDSTSNELIGDLRSLGECRELLTEAGRRPRRIPVPTWMFKAMVGDEFIRMWRWLTELDDIPITPGLMDVPTWIGGLDDSSSGSTPAVEASGESV